jgi:hypothetical protein
VDDEDDCFELAVPVGDGDACDASNKVGKKSNLKSTGSTTEHRAPTKKVGYKRSRKENAEKEKASLKKNEGVMNVRRKLVDKLIFVIEVNVILQHPFISYLVSFSWYCWGL